MTRWRNTPNLMLPRGTTLDWSFFFTFCMCATWISRRSSLYTPPSALATLDARALALKTAHVALCVCAVVRVRSSRESGGGGTVPGER